MGKKVIRTVLNAPSTSYDATIVPDTACFPVKEAMAKIKCDDTLVALGRQMANVIFNCSQSNCYGFVLPGSLMDLLKQWDAVDQQPRRVYNDKVEKMKQKTKVR